MKFQFFLSICLLFIGLSPVDAQSDESIGNWNVFLLKGNIGEKNFFNGEFNFRKNPFKPLYDYSEYKLVFGRTLNKRWSMDLGTGYYTTGLDGSFLTAPLRKEYRIWLDVMLKNNFQRIYLDHRVRIEERFKNSSGAPTRFRYRPSITIPVNHTKVTKNTLFFNTSNDTYFGTGEHRLELLMFFVGGGYKFNDRFTLSVGNMDMADFRKATDQQKNYLYTMLVYDFTAKKHAIPKESVNGALSIR